MLSLKLSAVRIRGPMTKLRYAVVGMVEHVDKEFKVMSDALDRLDDEDAWPTLRLNSWGKQLAR